MMIWLARCVSFFYIEEPGQEVSDAIYRDSP